MGLRALDGKLCFRNRLPMVIMLRGCLKILNARSEDSGVILEGGIGW